MYVFLIFFLQNVWDLVSVLVLSVQYYGSVSLGLSWGRKILSQYHEKGTECMDPGLLVRSGEINFFEKRQQCSCFGVFAWPNVLQYENKIFMGNI